MSIKARLAKLESKHPLQARYKVKPIGCFYGKDIPESEWPEFDPNNIPTLSDFYEAYGNELKK